MVCSKCGAEFPEGKAFCPGCGQPLISVEPLEAEPDAVAGEITRPAAVVRVKYAGFWLRFLAFVIDWVSLSLLLDPLVAQLFPSLAQIKISPILPKDPVAAEAVMQEFWKHLPTMLAADAIVFVAMGIYFSLMESSAWQATLGKRLLGLQVTDLRGGRISFARATERHFAKLLSFLSFCIGFVLAGTTKRKQALHDIVAACLVIKRPPAS
jgi:uncharacterized RDD family membrane protein YckC